MSTDALLELLRDLGADKIPHSGQTLLDHLTNTASIIQRWTDDEDTYKAALFHSIYGTEFFKNAPLKSLVESAKARSLISDAIGPAAERLVYVFCVMDRGSLGDFDRTSSGTYRVKWHGDPERTPLTLFEDEFAQILQIVFANLVEQSKYTYTGSMTSAWTLRKSIEKASKFLPDVALRELRTFSSNTLSLLAFDNLRDLKSFTDTWPDKFFVTHGASVRRLDGLVDFSFDDLVTLPRRFTKAFTPKGEHVFIEPGDEREHYDAGKTIYWHSLKSPTIDAWVESLDRDLGLVPGATRVSAFASRKGAGLPSHYDPNDNFVCQARGQKTWRVSSARVLYPTEGATIGMSPSRVVLAESGGLPSEMPTPETVVMQPGSVMFMPRGQWHDTVTEDESLHFNVQCGLANWKDAVEFALSHSLAVHAPELRAPILRTPNFKHEVQKKLLKVVEAIARVDGVGIAGDLEFDAEAFRQFVMRRKES